MPTLAIEEAFEPEAVPRKVWTRTECAALVAAKVIDTDRLELIEGDLIRKVGKKRPHTSALSLLLAWAFGAFGKNFVNSETSIDVSPQDNPTSEPEPDIIVLARPSFTIRDLNPRPQDIRLVIEVSDSSIAFEQNTKAKLYARAAVGEYWVLDVRLRRLTVHRDPKSDGSFGSRVTYGEYDKASALAAPDVELMISELFPEES